uniref:Uncharacterized protein n=1 Tax=Meloidogyne javanica TaxID=6303 RepID=A0A915N7A9_MELJA
MSKLSYIFLILIFSQILHPSSGGSKRGGRSRPSNTRGGGSRGAGSSAVGEISEVLKDIADIRDYLDCFRLLDHITEHPEDYHNIEQV